MIDETVILLTPVENYFEHRLAKYIYDYLLVPVRFDLYFHEPLQKIFSRVILYDYLKRIMEIGIKAVNKEIIELVRKEHPKYVVWNTMYGYGIRESTFEAIRKEGTIVAGWFLDDEVDDIGFDNYSRWWIPYIDYFITNSIETVPKYRALDARVIHTIPDTGNALERDWSNIKEKYDVSFVGRKYLDREQYINELKKRNISVYVFGRGWERGEHIPFEEMLDIFGASKINLNFSKVLRNQKQIKGRIFEVCLAGGFLLTEYVPSIENYFEIDKEIVCFHNAEEMLDKVIYYLNHDEERRAIAQAGWKRATGQYTCFHMLSRVFDEIEKDTAIKEKGRSPYPQKRKMSMQIRKKFSDYYFKWGEAFSLENYKGLWKGALTLSIRYYPFNTRVWCHYIIGFLSYSARITLIRLYRALCYRLNRIL